MDCSDYEDDFEWCSVCQEYIDSDQRCGHLWWDNDKGDWTGPGSENKGTWCKESFLKLLTETGIGPDLSAALENGKLSFEIQNWILYEKFFLRINGRDYSDKIYELEDRTDLIDGVR